MNRAVSLSALSAALLLAAATTASAQQSQDLRYVEVGRDFRQADRVTMGADLMTPEEQARFADMRQQAKTKAEKDRVEAEEGALLNQRVNERINAALNQPVQAPPSSNERPDSGAWGSPGMGSGGMDSGMGSGGMGSGTR